MKKRVFSAIQPTGNIHIGNYLSAIRNWAAGQDEFESFFCIADLHAITVPQNPGELKRKTGETAAILFAAGIDPEKTIVFVQSEVCAHSELAWILNCLIPMGWMERMTQFKEKARKRKEHFNVGLFDYPALMAADILLYRADLVPVGEDQKQHVELTRDAAQRFNSVFGETFTIPEPVIPETGSRIMGLHDPTSKMSKSETAGREAIYLLDSPDVIRAKVMHATTDSRRDILFDPGRPGIYNLLVIYELVTGRSRPEIEKRFVKKGYREFKQDLAEVIINELHPVQTRYREISSRPDRLSSILQKGAERARAVAEATLGEVKHKMGLGR